MDLENIMLSEISQSEKVKYHMISLICGIKWTNWINKQNRDRLIDKGQADSFAGCGLGGGGIKKKEKGHLDMDSSVVIGEEGDGWRWKRA